ncbi:hypothetical protein ABIB17_003577 [Arthrobacter sp. UYEF6]
MSVTLGFVLECPGRLDLVDARGAVTRREFRGESRAVRKSGEIDVIHHDFGTVVRPEARPEEITVPEVGFRAVKERTLVQGFAHTYSLSV